MTALGVCRRRTWVYRDAVVVRVCFNHLYCGIAGHQELLPLSLFPVLSTPEQADSRNSSVTSAPSHFYPNYHHPVDPARLGFYDSGARTESAMIYTTRSCYYIFCTLRFTPTSAPVGDAAFIILNHSCYSKEGPQYSTV